MMASVKENLIAAKALIDAPEKWSQGEYVDFNFLLSVECFCAVGALARAFGVEPSPQTCEAGAEYEALRAALPPGNWHGVVDFNDDHATTHADIMDLFDRAIAAQDEAP